MRQLDRQYARLNRVKAAVVTFYILIVLFRLAVIAQHLYVTRDAFIARRCRSRVAASPEIFPRIEAERRSSSHRSGFHPAVMLARKIFRSVGLDRKSTRLNSSHSSI